MSLYSRFPYRPPGSTPITKLDDDVLCMIFSATRDLDEPESRTWCSNVLVSHVCQRWRSLSIQYAPLWDVLIWSAGKPVYPALTVLERSKSAFLTVDLDAIAESPPSPDNVAGVHFVISAALSQLSRMEVCALTWSYEYWDSDVFAPLFSPSSPRRLPCVRDLILCYRSRPYRPSTLPDVHVVCYDLLQLQLQGVVAKNWASMLGKHTCIVALSDCNVQYDDFVLFLESTPALMELHVDWLRILNAPRTVPGDSDKVVGHAMSSLRISQIDEDTLRVLGRLIPIDKIDTVDIAAQHMDEDEGPLCLEFLRVPNLKANIATLHIIDDVTSTFIVIAPARAGSNSMCRTLTSTQSVLPFLPDALDGFDMFSTLEQIALDITQWADFMDLVATAPTGPCLPILQEIRLVVNQSVIFEPPEGLRDYAGPDISFPRLSALDIELLGLDPPSKSLVRPLLRAVRPLLFADIAGNPLPDKATMKIQFLGSGDHAGTLRCMYETVVDEGATPAEVMVGQAIFPGLSKLLRQCFSRATCY
ncbi:hypothetical protein EXIGLDRAFT_833159 [Exidia glandulosa HHB12029]|uniref:F-box domain-containing protein n=1 Tax=Exidia glandulosa HHB12029 TaxID=1314781 RepID=A0A165KX81_EXIGL|nr:hypothetical protein EXIGLDRAFT_833159 [Exidia glandulosa HHB12029]